MEICNCKKEFKTIQGLNAHLRFCAFTEKKCTKKSKYITNNGYTCECGKTYKKSQSLNAHFTHCLVHRNGKKPTNERFGGNRNWKAGKTAVNDTRVANHQKSLNNYYKENKGLIEGKAHTEAAKNKISEARTKQLLNGIGHSIWYEVNGVKVQGSWEKLVAEFLTENSIKWERRYLIYDKIKRYTPDFYLPDYDIYIEVKGWMKEKDINKMYKVIQEHFIDLRIIEYNELKNLEELKDIKNLPIFIEKYNIPL
jgi:hypothetical protein